MELGEQNVLHKHKVFKVMATTLNIVQQGTKFT